VLAGLKRLRDTDVIAPNDLVLCTLTGAGFKDMDIVSKIWANPPALDREIGLGIQAMKSVKDCQYN